ncbi:Auxin response factor 11 [Gossypium arboreum]|uniref:Auxin response factor 11 n=1 Tax=Gossypium arboreum TaxID=29729 RepID=A0A0B0PKC8_GOSAR|nr:Auxin response factor 11 [Gossypium arboreum]
MCVNIPSTRDPLGLASHVVQGSHGEPRGLCLQFRNTVPTLIATKKTDMNGASWMMAHVGLARRQQRCWRLLKVAAAQVT